MLASNGADAHIMHEQLQALAINDGEALVCSSERLLLEEGLLQRNHQALTILADRLFTYLH